MNNENIFDIYKPLRNHLKKLPLTDSLYVIWAYIQHICFNSDIPKDIEVSYEFRNSSYIQKIQSCSPWVLETLTKEIIINSHNTYKENTLKKWSYFAGALNKLRSIEGEIGSKYINQNNIYSELFRMAHRQFPWQQDKDISILMRYYKIFKEEGLDKIIYSKINLSVREIYLITLLLLGTYLKHPNLSFPISVNIESNELNKDNITRFIKYFSISLEAIKAKFIEEQKFDDKFVYSFNFLRASPIIEIQDGDDTSLVCPLPTLLFLRVTNGIYYEIYKEEGFDNSFGKSFEKYTGEVINKANINKEIKFFPEIGYDKNQKKSSDWLIYDENTVLFIECKTKRLRMPAKFELNNHEILEEELNKMADIIKQVYKTILDYKEGKYHSFLYDKRKKIFPLIVTLEDWYLFGNILLDKLDKLLKEKLQQEGIDLKYIQEMPYSICSMHEFEHIVQVIQTIGVSNFFEKKVFDEEKKHWSYFSFLGIPEFQDLYKNIKFLFPEDFEELKFKDEGNLT